MDTQLPAPLPLRRTSRRDRYSTDAEVKKLYWYTVRKCLECSTEFCVQYDIRTRRCIQCIRNSVITTRNTPLTQ